MPVRSETPGRPEAPRELPPRDTVPGAVERAEPTPQRTLADLALGESACVIGLECDDDQHRTALLNLGFIAGTRVSLMRVAPLGDPVEIRIRGYRIGLRRDEAACIWVEPA